MASVIFEHVDLTYPLRRGNIVLKEFFINALFRKKTNDRMTSVPALRDISFTIKEGERVGIIGYNGAGKSTLLRTIAGVYPITAGQRHVTGSICSLFDITAGFEIDSTGYENIYYRSLLQGETPQSVKGKVKDIAEFSELKDFLDLPIKHYSTGMLMRLAFSIATSSVPEILLIDEIFSTGDLFFQQKAQARMHSLLNRAKIVILVGHDLLFLRQFCARIIWLDGGRLHADGPAQEIIAAYHKHAEQRRQAAA